MFSTLICIQYFHSDHVVYVWQSVLAPIHYINVVCKLQVVYSCFHDFKNMTKTLDAVKSVVYIGRASLIWQFPRRSVTTISVQGLSFVAAVNLAEMLCGDRSQRAHLCPLRHFTTCIRDRVRSAFCWAALRVDFLCTRRPLDVAASDATLLYY